MNKINVSEPLNLSSMTVPKGSIPASIVSRHAETSAMLMRRCTRICKQNAQTQDATHAHTHERPRPTQAHVARQQAHAKI